MKGCQANITKFNCGQFPNWCLLLIHTHKEKERERESEKEFKKERYGKMKRKECFEHISKEENIVYMSDFRG